MFAVKCFGKTLTLALHESCSHYDDIEEEALPFWGGGSKKRIIGVGCCKGMEEHGV